MNAKFKFVRLVFAAAIGSLLWAGCASPRTASLQDSSAKLASVNERAPNADAVPGWRVAGNK